MSITGEIKANTGKIGGWSIDENGLKADDKDAFIYAGPPIKEDGSSSLIYEMLRISGEGEDSGTFVVKSDGTLYATNAYFHGSVAAGSFIANMKTEDAVDAIKRLELVNFYGTSFNYTNPNLDGDIILERDSLNFVCRQIGITCHTWKISKVIQLEDKDNGISEELDLCWSYSKEDKAKTEESYKGLIEASIINDLTFSLNCGIIEPNKETENEESVIFKIVGIATEFGYDDQGKVDVNKTVEEEYEYYFTIYNSKKDITKRISLFDPPSYSFKNPTLYEQSLEDLRIDKINTLDIDGGSLEEKFGSEYFIGNNFKDDDDVLSNFSDFLTSMELSAELLSQVTSNAEDLVNNNFELANEIIKYLNDSIALKNSKDFVLTLTNIDLRESNVLAESRARTGEAVLDGNSDSNATVFSDSTILVNDDFLKDGVLEINGRPIEKDNPVTGNEYNIEVFYEPAEEGSNESKLIFRVYRNDVPEGEELYLRYSYEKAFRTCNVFRPKNGANSINTVIKSSEGNMFKNGNVDTELSVEVYDGATLLNGPGTKYGYIWFQDGKAVERMLNQKEGIKITAEDFGSKANYTVHVYSSEKEAEQAYYEIELANKI